MQDYTLFESQQSDELPIPYCSSCGEPLDLCKGHQNAPEPREDISEEDLPW